MKELILKHLMEYGTITSLEAIEKYRCTRLSHYILVLQKEGYSINGTREPFVHSITGKKSAYVRYKLN